MMMIMMTIAMMKILMMIMMTIAMMKILIALTS